MKQVGSVEIHEAFLLFFPWMRMIEMNMKKQFLLCFMLMVLLTSSAHAQFDEPQIIKVEAGNAGVFEERFSNIKWTGQGFNYNSLDRMPAMK